MKAFSAITVILALAWLIFSSSSCDYHGMRMIALKYELASLERVVALYKKDHGVYPATLNVLIPDYVVKMPVDPWGNAYHYELRNESAEVYSLGEGGEQGRFAVSFDFSASSN